MDPKLARLEHEVGGIADRLPRSANRPRTRRPQNAIVWLYRAGGRKLDAFIDVCEGYWLAAAASGRKLIMIATRPPPQPSSRLRKSKLAFPVKGASKRPVARGSGFVLISMCFGLLIIFAVVLAVLFSQMKDMKSEIAVLERSLSAAKAQLGSVEKIAQQSISAEPKISVARQQSVSIVLDDKDLKIVRQFIKVLPATPDAQQRLHIGEQVADTASVPVPETLIDQLPKLRGAKFLIDQNGAIVLIGAGSNRVDAVVAPR